MGKLDGKVSLITGSDSGIGRATAIEFAREGAKLIVTYNSDEKGAKETLKKIEEAGSKGIILQIDVSKEEEVELMFDKALEEFETIDILVNNAAVNGQGFNVADMPTEVWDQAIKVNLYGYFYCTRRFIKIRKSSQDPKGKIINISSVHEEIAAPGTAEYSSSKGAVKMLMRTLALELAEDGINVNNIGPGMILTPMNQEASDDKEERDKKTKNIPMKRAGAPEEIAKLALFLASSDSDYVTGSTYFADGALMRQVGQGA